MSELKIEGIVFLILAWGVIIYLTWFCMYRVLGPQKKKKEINELRNSLISIDNLE
jgi:hypothetical protein